MSTSLSAGFLFLSPGCMIRLVFCVFFLPGLSLLILSLPLLGLGSKCNSLSPGFCVCRPRQCSKIFLEFDLFYGFVVSCCIIVLVDGVNGCVAAVLQEVGDADSRASTRSLV